MADDEDVDKKLDGDSAETKEHHKKKDTHHHESEGDDDERTAESVNKPTNFGLQQLCNWYMRHKAVSIPASVIIVLFIIFAVPFTRYQILGLFLKQDFSVVVVDAQTGRPVSSAQVNLRGRETSTNGEGKATLRVPVGAATLTVNKTYYNTTSQEVVVPLKKQATPQGVELEAVGRAIEITVVNTITGKPVAGAVLTADKSQAKTDEKGQAILVVPSGKVTSPGELSADGYNKTAVTIQTLAHDKSVNQFKLTPSGKVYFLSNQSGKIDVVESDLDGGNRKTIVAGTGKESRDETVLLATRDWKYLALHSKRDGGNYAKLFLINTADGSLATMDEGNVTFTLSGWEDHHFIYHVNRDKKEWEAKKQALKSYDADAKKLTTLDETRLEGSSDYDYMRERIEEVYVIDHTVIYTKSWIGSQYASLDKKQGKEATLNAVSPAGGNKKIIKGFATASPSSYIGLNSRPYGFDELYLSFSDGNNTRFYEYEEGKVKELPDLKLDEYYAAYPTYLVSPSGEKTFWSDSRDGKLAFFVGDAGGKNEKKVITLTTKYQTYGWYTDNYLLVSKDGSELFVMPTAGVETEEQLFKVTDYYRPIYTYPGYGGGYGGL